MKSWTLSHQVRDLQIWFVLLQFCFSLCVWDPRILQCCPVLPNRYSQEASQCSGKISCRALYNLFIGPMTMGLAGHPRKKEWHDIAFLSWCLFDHSVDGAVVFLFFSASILEVNQRFTTKIHLYCRYTKKGKSSRNEKSTRFRSWVFICSGGMLCCFGLPICLSCSNVTERILENKL